MKRLSPCSNKEMIGSAAVGALGLLLTGCQSGSEPPAPSQSSRPAAVQSQAIRPPAQPESQPVVEASSVAAAARDGSQSSQAGLFATGHFTSTGAVPWLEQGEDWCRFLGPSGTSHSNETGVDPALWQPHPPVIWSLPLGTSYGAPAIVGQQIYQFDRYGDQERLTCYDLTSRAELWRWQAPVEYEDMYGYNNGPRCSPVIDGDLIFLYGVAGDLYCLSAAQRQLLWKVNTFQRYAVVPNFFGVASNPVVHGDKLLVMVGGSPPESHLAPPGQLQLVKPNGSAIVALDKRTGQELYRLGDDLASYSSLTVQAIGGRPLGLAFLRGGLLAWEPDSGQAVFEYPWRADMLESVNAALPVTDGSLVLLSESYQIGSVLLDATQQPWQVRWQDSGPRNRCRFRAHWATPVLVDGYLYGCSGRNPADSDFPPAVGRWGSDVE